MIRRTYWAFLLVAACETVEADLPGQLVHLDVVTVADDCAPARLVGDGGTQFVATRADGGRSFSWPVAMQWGPLVDGGLSELGDRVELVPARSRDVPLGFHQACVGTIQTGVTDAGLEVRQTWPGESCPTLDFTAGACTSLRVLVLTPLQDCSSRCVRYDQATAEASCGC